MTRILKKSYISSLVLPVVVGFLLVLTLAACSGPPEGAWLNAPGWGRAQLFGQSSIPDPAPVALDGEGNIYTIFATQWEENQTLSVLKVDRDVNQVWESQLNADLIRPDQPYIAWDGDNLRIFWIDRERLYTATMDGAGQIVFGPHLLSGEETASDYAVASGDERQIAIWFGGTALNPGVFAVDPKAPDSAPRLVDADGYRPQLRFDAGGDLHAIWLHHPPGVVDATVFYGQFKGATEIDDGISLVSFTVGFTSGLEGPSLGVDGERVYVLWSILVRTGPAAGSATTSYISFPLGQPQQATTPQDLYVPAHYDLAYDDALTGNLLQAGPRVSLDQGGSRTAPLDMWTDQIPQRELVIAARAIVAYELRKQASQAMLIYFQDGQASTYQLLSFSRSGTRAPYVRSDAEGHLYATWMETGAEESRFVAYLAGTAPDVHAALNQTSLRDVGRMLSETIFGLLAGAVLSPFVGVLWLVAPVIVLAATSFLRHDDERTISPGSAVSLLLALGAYWAVKIGTLPGIGEHVPFSGWIPIIPHWLDFPLRYGVLILIAIAALIVAWRFTYRRQAHSALNFMLIYTAVDSVLSMAIYGSIVYGFF